MDRIVASLRVCLWAGCLLATAACSAGEPSWLDQPALGGQKLEAPAPTRGAHTPTANLLTNGDFESGEAGIPTGWGPLDNLTTFWVEGGPSGKGKCLKIDTDVYLAEWEEHKKAVAEGRADVRQKTPTSGAKYDTVAGTKGVQVISQPIRIEQGAGYMLSAALKGPSADMFYPKIFVKGYRLVKGQMREVWQAPMHCRTSPKEWRTFSWAAPKIPSKYGVEEVRIVIYCYWPPGIYEIDDVRFWRQDPTEETGKASPKE